jgi:hypothetical protein
MNKKRMKKSENGKVEAAVCQSFTQKRSAGWTISGPIWCDKVLCLINN